MIARDGFFYLSTPVIYSFSCTPLISECSSFLIIQSLRLLTSCDDISVAFNDVITFSDVKLKDGVMSITTSVYQTRENSRVLSYPT